MYKIRILLILGVWITVLPYLGFPYAWKDVLFTLSGLALVYVSYLLYQESRERKTENKHSDNFRENDDFIENKNINQEI